MLKVIESEIVFFAVVDGIGGSKVGEIVSRKVLMYLKERWESINSKEIISKMINTAHIDLIEYAQKNPSVSRSIWYYYCGNVY